jgi:hypothetical protein
MNKFFLVAISIIAALFLTACETNQERYQELIKKSAKDTSYYPYFAKNQYEFLHKQNSIGIIPGSVIIPSHEVGTLEYQMNASSWWGSWPNDVVFTNYFFAEQAKRKLGCGPLKQGTIFTIPTGIYTYKQQKISVANPLTWQLTTDICTMCLTQSYLPIHYYKSDSIYWVAPYSQNRINP